MAIIDYPNLTECLSTDVEGVSLPGFPDRPNGWFLKHLDTGTVHHRVGGVWVDWGLGLSFAPPTKSKDIMTNNDGLAHVTFEIPFYDTNYTVGLTCYSQGGKIVPVALLVDGTKLNTGFDIVTVDGRDGKPLRDVLVTWLATRHNA